MNMLLFSRLVVSDSLQPHGLQPTRVLCPQDSPGKSTGVGCHFVLQGIFRPRDGTCVSCIAGGFFTTEPPEKRMDLAGEGWGRRDVNIQSTTGEASRRQKGKGSPIRGKEGTF